MRDNGPAHPMGREIMSSREMVRERADTGAVAAQAPDFRELRRTLRKCAGRAGPKWVLKTSSRSRHATPHRAHEWLMQKAAGDGQSASSSIRRSDGRNQGTWTITRACAFTKAIVERYFDPNGPSSPFARSRCAWPARARLRGTPSFDRTTEPTISSWAATTRAWPSRRAPQRRGT